MFQAVIIYVLSACLRTCDTHSSFCNLLIINHSQVIHEIKWRILQFPGIYLFAEQIDKCHSSFKKVPIQKLIIKIFTDLPVLGTEPYFYTHGVGSASAGLSQ